MQLLATHFTASLLRFVLLILDSSSEGATRGVV